MLRLHNLVYFLVGILQTLIVFRFLFRALGANPNNPIVSFIYEVTAPFIAPFVDIFPAFVTGRIVIEWSIILALLFYSFVGYIVGEIFKMLTPRPSRDR